jgi:hypothetical protein
MNSRNRSVMPPTKLTIFGAAWHYGRGAKDRMKSDAASATPPMKCMLQLQDPDSGGRHFGCYPTWETAIASLKPLRGNKRHLFEIIAHGRPCKPYLDLDGPPLPSEHFATVADVVEHADRVVTAIFANDYGVALDPAEHLIWLVSPQAAKLSLHLVVCTHAPQHLYSSNHQSDPTGASHLAQRIRQLDPDALGPLVDVSVYTKDREMRAVGASKFGKPGSALVPFRPRPGGELDSLITCLDDAPDGPRLLAVPGHIPRSIRTNRVHALATPTEAAQLDPDDERTMIISRMLDLLRERVHPSAFHDRRGTEGPRDPSVGIKFNHGDRSEPCYTGVVHDGGQNLRCWIDSAGDVYAKCFSASCNTKPPHRIGRLKADCDAWRADAILVNSRFLDVDEEGPLNAALDRWLAGRTHGLSVRSPMGSGKSKMLDAVLARLPESATVLVATYRQTLAFEHTRKLRGHGFVSYLDYLGARRSVRDLADRSKTPRVICQIESLWRLGAAPSIAARFDVVVLDESESVLRHFASPTVKTPTRTMDHFIATLKLATRGVITLDAAWGAVTHSVFKKAGISNTLVINEHAPVAPRTFDVSNDNERWLGQIRDDLADGKNVVVVSLSSDKALAVHEEALKTLSPDRCVVHTSKTGDDVKKMLTDVDGFWSTKQLVVYSPTIAAGVDFSTEHFHRMYVYFCNMSALPSTALQMAFRVRHLADNNVRCLSSPSMRVSLEASRPSMTSNDMLVWLRWMSRDSVTVPERVASPPETQRTIEQMFAQMTGGNNNNNSDVEIANLPPVTHHMLVSSFVEAERHNAHADFLHEFATLAQVAGHSVNVSRIATGRAPPESGSSPSVTAERILAAVPISDEAEHEELRARVHRNDATEDDKWRLFAASYKAGWGVDRVDEAFVKANGTQPGSPEARLLCRVICPALRAPVGADLCLTEKTTVFRAAHVDAVVTALGLQSPFDTDTVVPNLMAQFNATVRHTEMFRDYKTTARLFKCDPEFNGEWTPPKVAKALNMVLEEVGLKLRGQEKSTGRGATRERITINYKLDADSVCRMTELVKMRLRSAGALGHVPNDITRTRLAACTYPKYGHLIDDDEVCPTWRAAYNFVEEGEIPTAPPSAAENGTTVPTVAGGAPES